MAYDYDLFPNFGQVPLQPSVNVADEYRRWRAMGEASGAARPGGLIPFQGQAAFAQRIGGMLPTMDMQPVQRQYQSPVLPSQQQFAQRIGGVIGDMLFGPGQPRQQAAPVAPAQPQTTDLGGFAYNQVGGAISPRASNYPTQTTPVPPITTNMPSGQVPFMASPQQPAPPFLQQPNWDALLAATPSQTVTQGVGGYAPSPMQPQQITPAGVSGYPGPITLPPLSSPQTAPTPAAAPTAQQNPLFTRPAAPLYQELDKIQADSQARARETDRLRAAGAAQNTDMILGDAAAANRNLGAVIAGRSPEGLTMNPAAPPMTQPQAQGMGLNTNYTSAVPAGFELVGSNLRRVAPPTQTLAGTDTPEAQAILNRQMPRVALPPMPQMEQRRGGQTSFETRDEYNQRMRDIQAARANRSPEMGQRRLREPAPNRYLPDTAEARSLRQQDISGRAGDTYAEQRAMREGREAELAMVQAKAGPARSESVKDQSIAAVNLARIEQMKNAPEYARRSMVDKARLDAIQARMGALANAAAAPLLEADERQGYLNEMNKLATEIDKFATSPDPSLVTTDGPGAPPLPQGGATGATEGDLDAPPTPVATRAAGEKRRIKGKIYQWNGKTWDAM